MLSSENPDDSLGQAEALERGRLLFAQDCRFVLGATSPDQVPAADLPEVAFAGRSNVGKSSLVNALCGRKGLARISRTPGRTQQLNFFILGGRLMLADLPGYGYAEASKASIEQWTRLVRAYLKGRAQLRRTCLLVDARRGIGDADRDVMELLDGAAVAYQVVFTKCDKVTAAGLADLGMAVAGELASHPAAHPVALATSARAGTGFSELRAELAVLSASELE
ncbi:MAG TPA: ribosome biogenesis GTP-binding protein YihA/YsxC [Rhodospirillales bacterium]|nr:ribosome biogenesis GTP-binding protein YihA/YsxC [Rhodospirillales bacterium]